MLPIAQLDVADWRRRTHELYAGVRTLAPVAGNDLGRTERDDLFGRHPASPITDRSRFAGLRVAPARRPGHLRRRAVPARHDQGCGPGPRESGLVIDVDFAYQPSCAYDPAWACPLAQPGNVVGVDLPVDELSA